MRINKNNYEAFLLDYIEENLSAEDTAELMLFLQQHPELETGIDDFKLIEVNKEDSVFDSKNELKRKEFVVNDDLIEGLIVSYINGDLSKAEENKLQEIIKGNSAYEKLLKQYQITKLKSGKEKLTDKVLLKGHLPITEENAEYFIIAETEGILTNEEKKALDEYKNTFPGIKQTALAYSAVKLKASEKIIFENKSSLKKKEAVIIAIWMRYVSVAAAACLILYFTLFTGTENSTEKTASDSKTDSVKTEKKSSDNLASNTPHEELKKNEIVKVKEEKENSVKLKAESDMHQSDDNANKEPMLDNNYAQDEFKSQTPNNETYVMMEKEIIKEIENKDEYALANNYNKNISSLNEDDFISPGQYVRNWAKKTFFTEEAIKNNNEETTTVADNNTLRLKGTNATIQNNTGKDYKEYGFSIGKFEFKRKVRK